MIRCFPYSLYLLALTAAGEVPGIHLSDKSLTVKFLDSDEKEFFISQTMDLSGRLFVGCREALYVYEPTENGGSGAPKFIRLDEGPGLNPPVDAVGNYLIGPNYLPAPERRIPKDSPRGIPIGVYYARIPVMGSARPRFNSSPMPSSGRGMVIVGTGKTLEISDRIYGLAVILRGFLPSKQRLQSYLMRRGTYA